MASAILPFQISTPNQNQATFLTHSLVAVGGCAVAWGVIEPASALGYLASTIAGVASAVLASQVVKTGYDHFAESEERSFIKEMAEKFEKRRQASLPSSENVKDFKINYKDLLESVREKIKKSPHFELFKQVNGFKTNVEAYKQLSIEKGNCAGFSADLLRLLEKNPNSSIGDLSERLDIEKHFYLQAEYLMSMDLKRAKSQHEEQKKILPKELLPQIEKAIASTEKLFFPWGSVESKSLSLYKYKDCLKDTIYTLLFKQNLLAKPAAGCISISDPSGSGGHRITFQCSPQKYFFHDPIHGIPGKFAEFSDQDLFFQNLDMQINQDLNNCRDPHFRVQIYLLEGHIMDPPVEEVRREFSFDVNGNLIDD